MNNLLTSLTPILYAIGEITKALLRLVCVAVLLQILRGK